jgi:hypothetical protein
MDSGREVDPINMIPLSDRPPERATRLANQQQTLITQLIESRETNNRQLLFEL